MAHLITTFYRPVIQTPLRLCPSHLPCPNRNDRHVVVAPAAVVFGWLPRLLRYHRRLRLAGQGTMWKWAWGLSLVGLPCLLTPQAVQPLFAVIAGVTEISLLTKVTGLLSIPATILCCLPHRQPEGRHYNLKPILLLSYGVMCWTAGPLAAFGCYFACLHSPFHLSRWRRRIEHASMRGVHALSALVLISLIGLVWWFPVAWPTDPDSGIEGSTLRYTFLALAALTVPHMTLLFLSRRWLDRGSSRSTPLAS